MRAGEADGESARRFFGIEVGKSIAFAHGPVPLRGPGNKSERIDQCGLATRSVSYDGDVADVFAFVLAHILAMLRERWDLLPARRVGRGARLHFRKLAAICGSVQGSRLWLGVGLTLSLELVADPELRIFESQGLKTLRPQD